MEVRHIAVLPMEPMATNFPFVRTLIILRCERTVTKTGKTSTETRYYISSAHPEAHSKQRWLQFVRGHWGGVENRNHWRRDAIMGEDRSRTRNANALANLAILRNTLLAVLSRSFPHTPLPQIREHLHSNPGACIKILRS